MVPTDALDVLLAPLLADPASAAVCTDFDGTLSSIVEDPAAARPLPGVADALAALAERYAEVAVISGRPASFLEPMLPAKVSIHGLYGLESVRDGVRAEHPAAAGWRAAIADVLAAARAADLPGTSVEDKGLSLTLHFRTAPEQAAAAVAWAEGEARRVGLHVRPARMSVELHPPVDVDKGTVTHLVAAGLRAACFLGDDAGDLAAFGALTELASQGVAVARVAVRSPEAPAALLAAADAIVEGPEGALDVLQRLAAAS